MLNGNNWQKSFPLGRFTRFGVGGKAKYFIAVSEEFVLIRLIKSLRQSRQKFTVIGAGTNLLVHDRGVGYLIIQNKLGSIKPLPNRTLWVGAGVNLNYLVNYCNRLGLAGLEKLAGIPGGLGGAVVGNAGAYGQEISNLITKVKIYDGQKVSWLPRRCCQFAYRESVFKQNRGWIVLAAELKLATSTPATLQRTASIIRQTRNCKYPVGIKCPGSYFKNVLLADLSIQLRQKLATIFADKIKGDKLPAAVLLDAVGLKGRQRGRIRVADYHANLILNQGGGRASDVLAIAGWAKKMVYEKFNIRLEEEVRILDN